MTYKPKKGDTLTVSDDEPIKTVNIIKADDPDYPERATVPELGLQHWLEQGWELDPN